MRGRQNVQTLRCRNAAKPFRLAAQFPQRRRSDWVAAAGLNLFAPRPAAADGGDAPQDTGGPGRRYVIRGGSVMSMDPSVGDFAQADVLVEGKKILAIGPNLQPAAPAVIDARGRIVMPGFIDTHHHQFETALRSFLADGMLINDGSGSPSGNTTYFEFILLKFAPVYRPQDVYINELFGGLSQLDDGVTTVHDVSQIHHSPQHSDAAIQALFDTGRRAAFGYFESAGANFSAPTPATISADAARIKKQWFSSSDQLVHMIMGGEVYLGDATTDQSWTIGRQLGLQIAAHILSPFGIRPIFDELARHGYRRQRPHRDRTGQPVHPHDRHVGRGLAEGQGRRRAGLDRRPDRDEHAARHAADPQDAEPGHGAVADASTSSAR